MGNASDKDLIATWPSVGGTNIMALTDSEREEFIALAEATLDAALWDESDLPFLRAARAEREKEQTRERPKVVFIDQWRLTEDDEDGYPDPHQTADDEDGFPDPYTGDDE